MPSQLSAGVTWLNQLHTCQMCKPPPHWRPFLRYGVVREEDARAAGTLVDRAQVGTEHQEHHALGTGCSPSGSACPRIVHLGPCAKIKWSTKTCCWAAAAAELPPQLSAACGEGVSGSLKGYQLVGVNFLTVGIA